MPKIAKAVAELTDALLELAAQQGRTCSAMADVAREQRVTNLIVRSQITTDPDEKARLLQEASWRMDAPRRRAPHDCR